MYGGRCAFQNRMGYSIVGRKFTVCALFDFLFGGHFQVQTPGGAYIRKGDFTEVFCVTSVGGGGGAFIWRGLYMELSKFFINRVRQK